MGADEEDAPPPYAPPEGYKPQEATLIPTSVRLTGLEPLIDLAAIAVNQQKEGLEAALNVVNIDYEGANKYKVKDPAGRPLYHIIEESSCCSRQCCNPNHSMTLHVVNNKGVRVMNMQRPWNWNCCCCEVGNCCGWSKMDVYMGEDAGDDDKRIGRVRMPCLGGGFTPKFNIEDRNGDVKAVVKGPCCCISDLCGAKFNVEAPGGREIGKVKKIGVRSGGAEAAMAEAVTDADNFVITFPQDLNIEYKALMIGTLLLLDYTFFEDEGAFEFDPFSCSCKFKCCDCFCCGCIVPCSCNCPAKKPEDDKGAPPAADAPEAAVPAPAAHAMRRDD